MTHIQKYTAVQQCSQTLPQAITGRSGKDVIQNAEEIYQELKLKEVGLGRYANLDDKENEFVEVYEETLTDLSQYCGNEESQKNDASPIEDKIIYFEKLIKSSELAIKVIADKEKIIYFQKLVKASKLAIQVLKNK